MTRREALKAVSLMLGSALVGSRSFLAGRDELAPASPDAFLTPRQLALLDEIGETILPATEDSRGAKAAEIGSFMQEIVSRNYSASERSVFLEGLQRIDTLSHRRSGGHFLSLTPHQRLSLLLELEADPTARFYRMMKELTLWGYFSSEVGATQALRHLPVPGRWDPCIHVAPDAKAWS